MNVIFGVLAGSKIVWTHEFHAALYLFLNDLRSDFGDLPWEPSLLGRVPREDLW